MREGGYLVVNNDLYQTYRITGTFDRVLTTTNVTPPPLRTEALDGLSITDLITFL